MNSSPDNSTQVGEGSKVKLLLLKAMPARWGKITALLPGAKPILGKMATSSMMRLLPLCLLAPLFLVAPFGSVQTLDIVEEHPDKFQVVALAAGSNVTLLAEQVGPDCPNLFPTLPCIS